MALGDKWEKLRGTLRTIFQIGKGGPNIKNNAGVLEIRNPTDAAYSDLRVRKIIINDGDEEVTIEVPELDASYVLKLPVNDGSPGQVLQTDGDGNLSWATVASGNDKIVTDTTSLAFGDSSPKAMFTLPANAVIHSVKCIVDTAFNGTDPTASVGVNGGSASKYMGTSDIDLKTAGVYQVDPGIAATGSTEALEITYVADTSSAGAARFEVAYSIPS